MSIETLFLTCPCIHAKMVSFGGISQVYDLVGLPELYYAGSHGMDIMGPEHKALYGHSNAINSLDQQQVKYDPSPHFSSSHNIDPR